MTRILIVAANWKMNKDRTEANAYASELERLLREPSPAGRVQVVVAPPYPSLGILVGVAMSSPIEVAAQNAHYEEAGAFTGEVSPTQVRNTGATWVILGHSERRRYFGETDEIVNRKVKAALAAGLKVIMCLGETIEQREAGETMSVLERQLTGGLEGLTDAQLEELVVAYEPIWAIGTGLTATDEQAQEAHQYLRGLVEKQFGAHAAQALRILYGGSVKPDNFAGLLSMADIDGGLVGGASLQADSMYALVKVAMDSVA